jgi:hypothetical protein
MGHGREADSGMLVDTQDAYTMYVSGSIVAFVWRGELTEAIVAHVEQHLHEVAETCGEPITVMNIASFRAPIPSPEMRTRIVQCFRALGPRLYAVAQVVEGDGFWAAAARCVMVGINLLSRGHYKRSVFGSSSDALVWLGRRRGAPELVSALSPSQYARDGA